MIYKFSVHRLDDEAGPAHVAQHLSELTTWRDYYVEVPDELSPAAIEAIQGGLANPNLERVEVGHVLNDIEVQVTYKRGIVDNENDSIVELCHMVGVPAVAAKVATTYCSGDTKLFEVVDAHACNHNIEEIHKAEPTFETLLPIGAYETIETFDLRSLDDEALVAVGRGNGRSLELDKMRRIQGIQRELATEFVTDTMLEALDARWSDHCAHTTWRSLGNLLGRMVESSKNTRNPNIVSMFHDNAGIWDFYDGYGIAVKAETHNGPSAVSAYFGQLTKIGGVLRDILGTGRGADPIGVFEYTATGLPESPSPIAGRPTPKRIANETIRAVKEYGNTFGVPMMSSQMTFHDDYRAKPFALGGSIGLIPIEHAQRGQAEVGDHAMLIGGLTGSDGIHGASASSAGASMDTTSVQIGSPLEEIKFREALLDLRDAGCIRAVTDLGAAGINSAFGEMGEDVGVWINTALVPLKTGGLPMWRILLSESQERMALAIAPEHLASARDILERHHVRATVIGRFTGTHNYCVVHDEDLTEKHVVEMDVAAIPTASEVGFDLPYSLLSYRPETKTVVDPRQVWRTDSVWPVLSPKELAKVMPRLLADCELNDQSFASSQYDSSVGGRTYYGPQLGSDYWVASGYWAARPVFGSDAAIVFSTSFNPWLFEAHPVHAARQCFLSLLTGQVLSGVDVLDICLCDNFYTPHLEPDSDSWLVGMVHEIAALAEQFRTPFISGKDSSAGSVETTEGVVSVPPAVFLSALGKVPDVARLRSEVWSTPGNLLVRVGMQTPSLAGTAAARALDLEANDVDEIAPAAAAKFLHALQELPLDLAPTGRLIGSGGVLGAVVLSALASGLGAELETDDTDYAALLQEHRVGAVIEVAPERIADLDPDLQPVVVGRIVERPYSVSVAGTELLTPEVIGSWQGSFVEDLS